MDITPQNPRLGWMARALGASLVLQLALLASACSTIDDQTVVVGPRRDADGRLLDPAPLQYTYHFRATAAGFSVQRNQEAWQPIWTMGVNFGLSLPGRSPGDFRTTREQIGRWLRAVADAGVNTVRIYTVQSPEFYREFRRYNLLHPDKPLFLLQGAWLKEPDEDPATANNPDYLSPAIRSWFRDEIDKVVDVVHGNRKISAGSDALPNNYGRAWGTFDADCSPWLMGYLVGREVEPYTFESTLALHKAPEERNFTKGKYFSVQDVTPVEAFIVEHLDYLMDLQVQRYAEQVPIGFSNWPTLDPLSHYTEPKIPVSAEDTYSIDTTKMQIKPGFSAGVFVSYHAYPYYPDFILYQPEYAMVSDEAGPNSYLGYLQDLRKYYKDFTVIISETGHPSSQGSAHFAASGLNHGGYNESEQGWANLRTLHTVAEAKLDGACLFSVIDEWFKRAWITDRVSLPPEHRRLWHNVMSPEQHFGMIALKPGAPESFHQVDGADGNDWKGLTPQAASPGPPQSPLGDGADAVRDLQDVTVDSDASFLHLRIRVASLDPDGDGQVDWSKVDYVVALDTLDPQRGDTLLSPDGSLQTERGTEFQVVIRSATDVQLLVDKPYDIYGVWHKIREPWQLYHTAANAAGEFNLVRTLTNEFYVWSQLIPGTNVISETVLGPRLIQETGRFRTGREQENSSSNFWFDAKSGVMELRIPWNLLNVTDPSQRMVVDDDGTGGTKQHEFHVVQTPGIGVAVIALGASAGGSGQLADAIPPALSVSQGSTGQAWRVPAEGTIQYQWPTWDVPPPFHEYLKASYFLLRDNLASVVPATIRLSPPPVKP